jgi:hypothetical protein
LANSSAPVAASKPASGSSAARSSSSTAVSARPNALDAVYTQCAWQRPDGRWLNSREIAEMENLARQYASLRQSGGFLGGLFGGRGGSKQRIEAIRAQVDALGIPFGIFQAYANSLDR